MSVDRTQLLRSLVRWLNTLVEKRFAYSTEEIESMDLRSLFTASDYLTLAIIRDVEVVPTQEELWPSRVSQISTESSANSIR